MKKKWFWFLAMVAVIGALVLSACQPKTVIVEKEVEKIVTQIVTEKIKETVIVEGESKVVEKEVTRVVEKEESPQEPVADLGMESPMLAEMVAAGDLPPVEERLPLKPLVVKDGTLSFEGAIPDFGLGGYGGTMRSTHLGGFNVPFFYVQVEPIVTGPEISLQGYYPNVVEGYELSDDYSTYTFSLRKGLKWSDGVPVTMDDVRFVFEDLYFNEKYSPSLLPWLVSDDEARTPVVFEALDDWTFRLTYAAPKGSLTSEIALKGAWNSWDLMVRPVHRLGKYHPEYTDAAELAALLDEAGLEAEDWPQLLDMNTCIRWDYGGMAERCTDYPGLGPYVLKEVTQEAATWDRNPYYWKVDEAGRQLPYIDHWVSVFTADSQTAQTLAMAGEVDIISEVDTLKAALFMEQGKKIGFDLVMGTRFHADGISFFINGCTTDDVVRPLLNDIRFREAMNFAMNRNEINDNLYVSFAAPPDWVMPSEYDPDAANALLDEMGLTARDDSGFRLAPGGESLKLILEYGIGWPVPHLQKATELFVEHLKEVGINAEPRPSEDAVMAERNVALEPHIQVWNTFTPKDADNLWPNTPGQNVWCYDWNWLESSGEPKPEGMPDEFVNYLQAVADRNQYVAGAPEDVELYGMVKDFYRNHYWVLITVGDIRAPIWVNGKLGNLTHENIQAGALRALEVAYFK